MQILDLSEVLVIYTLLGGFIVLFGLVSLIVKERLYLSEALVALLMGLIIGPACFHLVDPTKWESKITEELTRIVLAIQIMTAAINLPRAYITRQYLSMIIMLLPVMVWMWITSAVIIYFFIPSITFTETLLIASCITPTDPILANSVVQGSFAEKHIPIHVRHLLSAESGVNDALYLLESPNDIGTVLSKWVYFVWGYHILFSILVGFVIGWGARKLLRLAKSRNWIDKESFLVFAFALAIFIVGSVSILGSDALLSCFMAGTSFSWDDWFREETYDAHLQEVIDLLLNLTTFIYIGAMIPWSSFSSEELSLKHLIPISIFILIFRRLPIIIALKKFIPAIHTFKESVFAGYFGPIGVGAIFLAVTVEKEIKKSLDQPEKKYMNKEAMNRTREIIFPIVTFTVLSSVIVHGITVPILNIGSKIDIERLPSIASIGNHVVESLTLERDSHGHVKKKDKMKAEYARIPSRNGQEGCYHDIHKTKIEEEELEGEDGKDHVRTDIFVEIDENNQSNRPTLNSQLSNYSQELIEDDTITDIDNRNRNE
ncbi:17408_t:CDS:10 [Funneliformis geosporum]|uniref:7179_t:CDS:1 n=1 Tax=Funneliformis geosporum TaxID=1117311 RepID=A0A9W4SHQ4_9GLOM|nr:17408_t:CDS:10 [Funneliformis geosporum]CAI2169395.1 7179_t:CDS:10 [Funneliformis geosporum]